MCSWIIESNRKERESERETMANWREDRERKELRGDKTGYPLKYHSVRSCEQAGAPKWG